MKPDFPITVPNYAEYERRKRELIDNAVRDGVVLSSERYNEAIKQIARECGI